MLSRCCSRRKPLFTYFLYRPIAFSSTSLLLLLQLHYDNVGGDTGEFFEIAGPDGASLDGYTMLLYNGNPNVLTQYGSVTLSGTFGDDGDGYGFIEFPYTGIQNGSPDGLCLVDASNTVVQFLSYEGSFTASGGLCDGVSSTEIGSQAPNTPVGESLQLRGVGTCYEDFTWGSSPEPETPNAVNIEQSFGPLVRTFLNPLLSLSAHNDFVSPVPLC